MAKSGRHAEGARTRERVLEAAAALIAAQGYAATSITQISERSGANPASIYWAFGSKEGVLAAVMEKAADEFFVRVAPLQGDDPWQSLRDMADAFVGGPEFLRLMLVLSLERREGDPEVLKAARRIRQHARDGLAAIYTRAFPCKDAFAQRAACDRLARMTLMLFDGVFVASQIERDTTDLRRSFETIALAVQATGQRMFESAAGGEAAPAPARGRGRGAASAPKRPVRPAAAKAKSRTASPGKPPARPRSPGKKGDLR